MMQWFQQVISWFSAQPEYIKPLVYLLVGVAFHMVVAIVYKVIAPRLARPRLFWLRLFLKAARLPLLWFVWLWLIGFTLISFGEVFKLQALIKMTRGALPVFDFVMICWFFLRMVNHFEEFAVKSSYIKLDNTLIHGLAKLAKILLFFFALVSLLQSLGVPVAAIYTAAGGASLGISLAAKDIISNFLAGVILYFERPFKLGDWIVVDNNVAGVVKDISWRNTVIKNFRTETVYVPNSQFSTKAITNTTARDAFLFNQTIGVRYQDISKLPAIVEQMEALFAEYSGCNMKKLTLKAFSASSVDILCQVYFSAATFSAKEFVDTSQEVLLKIADIVQKNGADMAYPTTTIEFSDTTKLVTKVESK